jgi:ketopantoate reductase
MRYVCVGVGGVGGSVAARLALAGHEVVAIARNDHLQAMRELHGLRLRTPAEDSIAPVTAVAQVSEMEPPLASDDVVIVGTKVHQAAAVLTELAAAAAGIGDGLGEPPAVCCLTNGLDCERQALRTFPRTYGILPFISGGHTVPGEVALYGAPPQHAWLPVGRFPTGTDETSDAGPARSWLPLRVRPIRHDQETHKASGKHRERHGWRQGRRQSRG